MGFQPAAGPRCRPGRVMGKAYSCAANLAWLRERHVGAVIPVREDQEKHRGRGRAAGRRSSAAGAPVP